MYKGTTVLREEEAKGWEFMNALTPKQRAKAVIGMDLPFDGYASGFKDNIVVAYDGLPVPAMTPAQRHQFIDLIALYTDRLPPRSREASLGRSPPTHRENNLRLDRRSSTRSVHSTIGSTAR